MFVSKDVPQYISTKKVSFGFEIENNPFPEDYFQDKTQYSEFKISDDDSMLDKYLNNINYEFYNFDKYQFIYNYISNSILPNYTPLTKCYKFDDDEMGEQDIEFHIIFEGKLSFNERQHIHHEIIQEVYDYCNDNDFINEFKCISIFLKSR